MISPSDWVLIGSTITLGAIALFGPYLNDFWKRKSLAPKLKIVFQKEYPYIGEPERDYLYDICFGVKNEGNSEAKNCEVIIEEFYFKNKKGDLIENNRDFPAQLRYTIGPKNYLGPVDILPKANKFFHIFYIAISTQAIQLGQQEELIFFMNMERIVPSSKGDEISVLLNYLKIKIVIYSENAKKCEQYIEIESPGIKREKKEDSLQELQIKLL
ncbi:MAG: hypothetical protein WBC45_04930 [Atribacterota bacterium]